MKQFLAIVLLVMGASVAQAQTPEPAPTPKEKPICTLALTQAPAISGVSLGMTVEQVLALFPGSSEDKNITAELTKPNNPFAMNSITIMPANFKPKADFTGISQITFKFIERRVSIFRVGYNGPEWKDVDEFVAKLSETSNLPAVDFWEAYPGMDTQLKILKCGGFETSAFAGGKGGNINYVEMRDVGAERALKDRRAKAKEKAAQTPKP